MPLPERFGKISEIRVEDEASWRGRIFLTFDVDWACDEVIDDTAALVEAAGAAATWFVTHDTPMIARLRANPRFELGIHPNFNFLLSGDLRSGADATDVLDRLLALIPEAKAIRSHSMAQTSVLLNLFAERGLSHDCNHFIPDESGIELKPWLHWNGLIKVPYSWEDDVRHITGCMRSMSELADLPGLRVFDFHPTHVFLNTESMERYDDARPHFLDSMALLERRGAEHAGTRDRLQQLLGCR